MQVMHEMMLQTSAMLLGYILIVIGVCFFTEFPPLNYDDLLKTGPCSEAECPWSGWLECGSIHAISPKRGGVQETYLRHRAHSFTDNEKWITRLRDMTGTACRGQHLDNANPRAWTQRQSLWRDGSCPQRASLMATYRNECDCSPFRCLLHGWPSH